LKLTSDATSRFDALEDNQISIDHSTDVEVVGCEIDNSAATGIFLYGSTRTYVEGNYVHHTFADHVHHTSGARQSWVWDNWFYNLNPDRGDDAIACVTYCPTCDRCGEMEWWNTTHWGGGWGRGYSVIGGDHIEIHHNWAIRTAGAGIIVASESSFNSATSDAIVIHHNALHQCAQIIGHPGILVSGQNPAAEPISNIELDENVVVATATGQAFREEGATTQVTNQGMSTAESDLPTPHPELVNIRIKDTSVLRTQDTSFVPEPLREGLYRIHVRQGPAGFQQRFEYIVRGDAAHVDAWVAMRRAQGDHVSNTGEVGATTFARVLTGNPMQVPPELEAVTFADLREGERDGTSPWLWEVVNAGTD
jgi:parallel beta-helix repeat protein